MYHSDKNERKSQATADTDDLNFEFPSQNREPWDETLVIKLQVALSRLSAIGDQLGHSGLIAIGQMSQAISCVQQEPHGKLINHRRAWRQWFVLKCGEQELPIEEANKLFAEDSDIGIFWTHSSKNWIPDGLDAIKTLIDDLECSSVKASPQTVQSIVAIHSHFESLVLAALRKEVAERLFSSETPLVKPMSSQSCN